jgi:Fibronectin type III domain
MWVTAERPTTNHYRLQLPEGVHGRRPTVAGELDDARSMKHGEVFAKDDEGLGAFPANSLESSAVTHRLGRLWRHSIITPVTTALILAGCAASGVLDVSWTAPTTNTDGRPVTDVVSYRVYYSSTTDAPCKSGGATVAVAAAPKVPLPPDQRLVVRLTGLTMGKLYFVSVSAVTSRGNESECTSTVSARARQP